MKLSRDNLKKLKACEDGINFLERNGLIDLESDNLKITGDYERYFSWFQERQNVKRKYDDRGNCIEITNSSGDKYTYKYDDRNNCIEITYPDGYKSTYKYDDRNNCIEKIYPNGNKSTYKYDDRNNCIEIIYPNGNKSTYKYKFKNKILHKIYCNGKLKCKIEVEK